MSPPPSDQAVDLTAEAQIAGRNPRDEPLLNLFAGRISRRSLLIVIAFASLFLLPALGGRRVLTHHEALAAQPAREMISDGHWIIPTFAGKNRTNKPPGMGWLIAGSMKIFHSRDEWVVRLPSALSGILIAVSMSILTARWLGDFAGLIAGLMQSSLYYVLLQSRLAEADMPMAAAICIAMTAFAIAVIWGGGDNASPHARPRWWALLMVFHAAAAASVVLKGIGPVFIYSGCTFWIVATRRWNAFRFLFNPRGLLLFALLAGIWPLLAWREFPPIAGIWYREVFGRIAGEMGEPDPWYVYFYSVPEFLLPWLPFVVIGAIDRWKHATLHARAAGWTSRGRLDFYWLTRRDPRLMFIACWFLGGMTLLTFSAWKHMHYAIPMLPPLTILAAAGFVLFLQDAQRRLRKVSPKLNWSILVPIAFVINAAVVLPAILFLHTAHVEIAATAALIVTGIFVAAVLHARGHWRAVLVSSFSTALIGGLAAQFFIIPRFDDYKANAELARRANGLVPTGEPIYFLKFPENQAAFYLDHPALRIDRTEPRRGETQSELAEFLVTSRAHDLYLFCSDQSQTLLAQYGQVTLLTRSDHLRKSEKERLNLVRLTRILK